MLPGSPLSWTYTCLTACRLLELRQVIIAATEKPSINDITAAELRPLLARAAEPDALLYRSLAERTLRVVSSGNDLGVIDLSRVGAEVAAEAADSCDLVVLEGMGRGIETNLDAQFTVDSVKLAMIKVSGRGGQTVGSARAST